ncbi:hypothetical protein CISG_08585 [Coccidioides immitis RMSCC 3703]|uniref:Secreted protein n=1 Tax=Coccidioides immitis RMSCC 3703 TaxID=454286 RepID=A0A0J8U2D4_COCIT|nr:hypothetical protein CISG_08585 [Coccidioides immitis RMSCC 3703]
MKPTLLLLGLAAEALAVVLPEGGDHEVTRTFELPPFTDGHPWPTKRPTNTHSHPHPTRTNRPTRTRTGRPWPTRGVDERDVVEDIVERDDLSGDAPDPDKVHIVSVNYGGTGCPQGSARTVISDDRETITVIFDKYVAAIGPMFHFDESRKELDQGSRNWSPCGSTRALNINSQVRLTSRDKNASGVLTNDSIDADFRQIFHIKWRKC